jgi:hypothetical protein
MQPSAPPPGTGANASRHRSRQLVIAGISGAEMPECAGKQPGDVHLGDTQLAPDLVLGHAITFDSRLSRGGK